MDAAIDSKKVGSAEVGGATAGGILALLALLVVFVILWYCGQQQRKKYNSRLLIRNKELLDQFILRYD